MRGMRSIKSKIKKIAKRIPRISVSIRRKPIISRKKAAKKEPIMPSKELVERVRSGILNRSAKQFIIELAKGRGEKYNKLAKAQGERVMVEEVRPAMFRMSVKYALDSIQRDYGENIPAAKRQRIHKIHFDALERGVVRRGLGRDYLKDPLVKEYFREINEILGKEKAKRYLKYQLEIYNEIWLKENLV